MYAIVPASMGGEDTKLGRKLVADALADYLGGAVTGCRGDPVLRLYTGRPLARAGISLRPVVRTAAPSRSAVCRATKLKLSLPYMNLYANLSSAMTCSSAHKHLQTLRCCRDTSRAAPYLADPASGLFY